MGFFEVMFVIMNRKFLAVFGIVFCSFLTAQTLPYSQSAILTELRSLGSDTRVLYVAAHPDDENTRVISWLSHAALAETAYLSLTRGDGGQNLIGSELGPSLGVIRTNELLEARKIDGGVQFFTRAIDFGYSKTALETFEIWDREAVLGDVVFAIRKFQPHIIITRFPPDEKAGHGHHTASAILAEEAFDLAANPNAYPEQLKFVQTWQPLSLYWNASAWWDKSLPQKAKSDPKYVAFDVGSYDAVNGVSCNELASLSRSMHKSQGFGIPMARGLMPEYLEHKKGENRFLDQLFGDSLSNSPTNVALKVAEQQFLNGNRLASLNTLIDLMGSVNDKRKGRIQNLIAGILGLYVESAADTWFGAIGEKKEFRAEALLRIELPLKWKSLWVDGKELIINQELKRDSTSFALANFTIEANSQPFWLDNQNDKASFAVLPQNPVQASNQPSPHIEFEFDWQGKSFKVASHLVHKWTDRVFGELQRPFVAAPSLTVNFNENALISRGNTLKVTCKVKAWRKGLHNNLKFEVPEGWVVKPAFVPVDFENPGDELEFELEIFPPKKESEGQLKPILEVGEEPLKSFVQIDYPHIRKETLFQKAGIKLVNAKIDIELGTVGFIPGAGDYTAEALQQLGFEVEVLDEKLIKSGQLDRFMAIVCGIRAYNTCEWLPEVHHLLLDYVKKGGHLVVQYNTNGSDLKLKQIGPYPLEISRQRVTEENAKPAFIDPEHRIFNEPNRITLKDFDGWVQERGLYFADSWSKEYFPLISWNDANEPPRLGGLLVSHYGQGSFVYTGIAFFRQLPEGVPGAYKLLANLICYEPQ